MNYKEYCKVRGVQRASPFATSDFYEELYQIAVSRCTVLDDIEQMSVRKLSIFYRILQRGIDLLLSGFGLLIGAVPLLAIAIAVKIDSKGPVFYLQTRVGKNGEVFQMIKFRTMSDNAERTTGPVWAADQDPRLTFVGTFLRRTRLDELPQLFNILKGDMTFVGPRPERPEFVYQFVQYIPAFDRRHDVKPGMAGFAQLRNGYDTSARSVYRKLRWDAQYMRNRCVTTDFCTLYRTVIAVLRGRV
jgi:lipopolysaccharide/colanic/teichoic acid biosynthesis glycosyltransferase